MSQSIVTSRQNLNALQNLLTYSDDYSGYSKTNSVITANTVANPIDGAITASTFADDTTSGSHAIVGSTMAFNANEPLCFSGYFKNNTRRYVGFWYDTGALNMICVFDLQTGTATFTQSTPIGTALTFTATIEDVGNGWYRLSAILTMANTGVVAFRILLSNNGTTTNYVGNGSSVYIYRLQATRSNWSGLPCLTAGAAVTGPIRNKLFSRAAITSRSAIS